MSSFVYLCYFAMVVEARPLRRAAKQLFTMENLRQVPESLGQFYRSLIEDYSEWSTATAAGRWLPISILVLTVLAFLLPIVLVLVQIVLACCTKTSSLKKEVKKKTRENNYLKQSLEFNMQKEPDIEPRP